MKSLENIKTKSTLDLIPKVYNSVIEMEAVSEASDYIKGVFTDNLSRLSENAYLMTANEEVLIDFEVGLGLTVGVGDTLDERRYAIIDNIRNTLIINEKYVFDYINAFIDLHDAGYDVAYIDYVDHELTIEFGWYDLTMVDGRLLSEELGRLLASIIPMNMKLNIYTLLGVYDTFHVGIFPVTSIVCAVSSEEVVLNDLAWWQWFLWAYRTQIGAEATGYLFYDNGSINHRIGLCETVGSNTFYPMTSMSRYEDLIDTADYYGVEAEWHVTQMHFWNLEIAYVKSTSMNISTFRNLMASRLAIIFNEYREKLFTKFGSDYDESYYYVNITISDIGSKLLAAMSAYASSITVTTTGVQTATYNGYTHSRYPALGTIDYI